MKKKQPNLNMEMGWSIFKCMFVLLIFTNLLWAGIFIHYVSKSFDGTSTSTEMWQDGSNNNQSITNG